MKLPLLLLLLAAPLLAGDYLTDLQPSALPTWLGAPRPPAATTPPRTRPAPSRPARRPTITVLSPYARGVRRLTGPHGEVHALDVSPDGKRATVASYDRAVHIFDLESGERTAQFSPGDGEVERVRWSPDGTRLAVVSHATSSGVGIWDMSTTPPSRVRQLEKGGGFDEDIAFSPDGRLLVTGGHKTLLVYGDGPTPALELPTRDASITRLAFSRDGRRLFAGDHDGFLLGWEVIAAPFGVKAMGVFPLPKNGRWSAGRVQGLAVSPSGETVWVTTPAQWIPFDVATRSWGEPRREHGKGYSLAVHPGGEVMASGQIMGQIRLAATADGRPLLELRGHRDSVEALGFLPDGRLLSGSEDGSLVLWELAAPAELLKAAAPGDPVQGSSFPPRDSFPRLGQPCPVVDEGALPSRGDHAFVDGIAAAFSPDGRTFLTGYSGRMRLVRRGDEKPYLEHERVTGAGIVQAFGPDGGWVAYLDKQLVKVVETANGAPRQTLKTDGVGYWGALAISPDGRRIAATHGATEVVIWDRTTGAVVQTLKGQSKLRGVSNQRLHALAFSPDGSRLVTGGTDTRVRLFDLASGQQVATGEGHQLTVRRAAFLPAGGLVTVAEDKTVRWWGPDLSPRRTEAGHTGPARALALAPALGMVLTGGTDGAVIFWDLDGTKRLRLETDVDEIDYLAVSPDGAELVAAGEDDGSGRYVLAEVLAGIR